MHLLTAKPFLYVFNMDVGELSDEALRKQLGSLVAPAEAIFLDAKTEADLTELPEDEAAELLAEAGMGEPGLSQLAWAGFRALGLPTFLWRRPAPRGKARIEGKDYVMQDGDMVEFRHSE